MHNPLGNTIEHDGLRFRPRTEARMHEELKERKVIFFANATAVLGGQNVKREPDFLVCQDRAHTPAKRWAGPSPCSSRTIEFYDAPKCYDDLNEVNLFPDLDGLSRRANRRAHVQVEKRTACA